MTKDVLVTVRGLQMTPDGDDTIEVTTTGKYYEKDGKWVLNHTVVDPSMKGQGIFSMMRLAMIPT